MQLRLRRSLPFIELDLQNTDELYQPVQNLCHYKYAYLGVIGFSSNPHENNEWNLMRPTRSPAPRTRAIAFCGVSVHEFSLDTPYADFADNGAMKTNNSETGKIQNRLPPIKRPWTTKQWRLVRIL